MSFTLYLILVTLTFVRVFEAFAPELADYRPMLVLSLATLIASLVQVAMTHRIAAAPKHFLILLGFVGSIALSLIVTGWVGGAAAALIDFAPVALLFVVTVLNVTSLAKLRVTCAVVVLSMFVAAAGSVAAYHTGFMADKLMIHQLSYESTGQDDEADAASVDDDGAPRFARIRNLGMLSDPNDFAQAIIMVLPLLWLAWRPGHGIGNLMFVVLPTAFFLYAIYLTHSRGALVGLIAVLLVRFHKSLGRVRTAALIGLLVVGAVVTNFSAGRGYSASEESAGNRLEIWSGGLEMLKAHPLFGVGYGNFVENSSETGLTAHNSIVLCLGELGLVGCFFWLALIVVCGRELQYAMDRGRTEAHQLVIGLRTSMAGFLACALFLSRTYSPHLFLTLGLCAAACHCSMEGVEEDEEEPVRLTWAWQSAAAVAASILVLYVAIRLKHAIGN